MMAEGYRMDTLHVWGTHDLSTKDLLDWLEEYNPKGVEWIDDSSCKRVFVNNDACNCLIANFFFKVTSSCKMKTSSYVF